MSVGTESGKFANPGPPSWPVQAHGQSDGCTSSPGQYWCTRHYLPDSAEPDLVSPNLRSIFIRPDAPAVTPGAGPANHVYRSSHRPEVRSFDLPPSSHAIQSTGLPAALNQRQHLSLLPSRHSSVVVPPSAFILWVLLQVVNHFIVYVQSQLSVRRANDFHKQTWRAMCYALSGDDREQASVAAHRFAGLMCMLHFLQMLPSPSLMPNPSVWKSSKDAGQSQCWARWR